MDDGTTTPTEATDHCTKLEDADGGWTTTPTETIDYCAKLEEADGGWTDDANRSNRPLHQTGGR